MTHEEIEKNIMTLTAGDEEMDNIYSYLAPICTENECLEKLSLLSNLKQLMKTDVVKFVFKKLNGEVRTAFGTRAEDVLSQNGDTPQGRRKSLSTFPYYDIERKAWRCFKPELLQEICLDYTL